MAKAVDAVAERFKKGGRIIYCGAGTSGRMGTLDAVELTPTYSVSPDRAFGLLAGGEKAMYLAVEGAEDSAELAVEDLKRVKLTADDCVIGVAASGRTPYTLGAIRYANETGALSVSVTLQWGQPDGGGGTDLHRPCGGTGGHQRFHQDEGGNRPEDGAQHDSTA